LWDPAQFRYPWLESLPELNRAIQPAEFNTASKSAEVSKFIFIECGCDPAQALAEVDWVSSLAKREPRLRGIVAHALLAAGSDIRSELGLLANCPLVKGVRRNLQSESDPAFCLRPAFVSGVRLLAELGFTFDLCIRPDQLQAVTELARRVPQVTFILDHLGKPEVCNHKIQPWAKDLEALAALPNVVAKISGLATEADWNKWQPADLAPYLMRAFTAFGPDRLLFGSDWPVMTLATTYVFWLETVLNQFPISREQDWVRLFQTNAERIYRV